jgi:hypothetical protein
MRRYSARKPVRHACWASAQAMYDFPAGRSDHDHLRVRTDPRARAELADQGPIHFALWRLIDVLDAGARDRSATPFLGGPVDSAASSRLPRRHVYDGNAVAIVSRSLRKLKGLRK